MRVLIVDDEARIADLVSGFFRIKGEDAHSCSSALAALEKVRAEPWDLVLTDLAMTEMDGCALAEQIHATAPGTSIYLMTGNPDVPCPHFVDGVLGKPFDLKALNALLTQYRASSHASPAGIEPTSKV